jgi:hypothetical protein
MLCVCVRICYTAYNEYNIGINICTCAPRSEFATSGVAGARDAGVKRRPAGWNAAEPCFVYQCHEM